jgi:hypothetical protein
MLERIIRHGDTSVRFTGIVDEHRAPHVIGEAVVVEGPRKGERYSGEYAHGKRHGHGQLHLSNGDVYTGTMEADVRSGVGEVVLSDGAVLCGRFANDSMHGVGRHVSSTGAVYDGEWEAGQRHGQGVASDGEQRRAEMWRRGELVSSTSGK